jgi:hypothetical protein
MRSAKGKNLTLNRVARTNIGSGLRAEYKAVTGEPIPDEHVYLLLALRQKEREQNRDQGRSSPGGVTCTHPHPGHDQGA